jgi:hypothetical protein
MAKKTLNPLLDLAWAFLPEPVVVARVAHQILEEGWEWVRGEKMEVRAIVRKSRPPRGLGKKRLEAVVAEMKRQDAIRDTRLRPPIDWAAWRPDRQSGRRQTVAERILGITNGSMTCHSLSGVNGSKVMLIENHGWNRENEVVILRPKPKIGPRQEIRIKIGSRRDYKHATEALLCYFAPKRVRAAMLAQHVVWLDFDLLETQIEQKDGSSKSYPWTKPGR